VQHHRLYDKILHLSSHFQEVETSYQFFEGNCAKSRISQENPPPPPVANIPIVNLNAWCFSSALSAIQITFGENTKHLQIVLVLVNPIDFDALA
jgi:hypothetical protein